MGDITRGLTFGATGDVTNTTLHNLVDDATINTGAVTESKIGSGAVTANKIGADAVNGSKIADDSIDSEHYVDGSIDTAHLANSAVSAAKIADGVITAAKMISTLQNSFLPVGSIVPYTGSSAPTGFLECDGSAISRTTYSDLYSAIGDTHGEGDGSTTFNVPDYRGYFLRGYDHGAENDPDAAGRTAMATGGNTGDNVGSVQADDLASHRHGVSWVDVNGCPDGGGEDSAKGTDTKYTDYTGGNETRPINASVMFIIKY